MFQMVNQQPPEKSDLRQDGSLEVHSVFETIQGEGPLVGSPSVFVRLAGCNLECSFCDTDYTSMRKILTPGQLLSEVGARPRYTRRPLIVITGGEPFRQNLGPFVALALYQGFPVQIETNGTLYQDLPYSASGLTVVCSPKSPKLNPQLRPDAFKYILQEGQVDAHDGLPVCTMGSELSVARPLPGIEVFIQPLDEGDPEKNKLNTEAAVASCLKYGYRLSLQLHKFLGLE